MDRALSGSDRPKTANERALEQIRANRPAVLAKVAALTEADAARVMADAFLNAQREAPSPDAPIGAKVPLAAKYAMGKPGRVFNPKIHKATIDKVKPERFEALPYIRRGDAVIDAERQPGEVRVAYLRLGLRAIAWGASRVGHFEQTFKQLARLLAGCVETARKVIRWHEAHYLIDTVNPLVRLETRELWRGANVYVPLAEAPPEASADAPPIPPELAPLARANQTLNRLAARWGLVTQAWGLNATPVASKHSLRRERDPEPA